jgi:hypothetical protein
LVLPDRRTLKRQAAEPPLLVDPGCRLATRESVALRELAGQANTVFLGLGLEQWAFGSSGMPL